MGRVSPLTVAIPPPATHSRTASCYSYNNNNNINNNNYDNYASEGDQHHHEDSTSCPPTPGYFNPKNESSYSFTRNGSQYLASPSSIHSSMTPMMTPLPFQMMMMETKQEEGKPRPQQSTVFAFPIPISKALGKDDDEDAKLVKATSMGADGSGYTSYLNHPFMQLRQPPREAHPMEHQPSSPEDEVESPLDDQKPKETLKQSYSSKYKNFTSNITSSTGALIASPTTDAPVKDSITPPAPLLPSTTSALSMIEKEKRMSLSSLSMSLSMNQADVEAEMGYMGVGLDLDAGTATTGKKQQRVSGMAGMVAGFKSRPSSLVSLPPPPYFQSSAGPPPSLTEGYYSNHRHSASLATGGGGVGKAGDSKHRSLSWSNYHRGAGGGVATLHVASPPQATTPGMLARGGSGKLPPQAIPIMSSPRSGHGDRSPSQSSFEEILPSPHYPVHHHTSPPRLTTHSHLYSPPLAPSRLTSLNLLKAATNRSSARGSSPTVSATVSNTSGGSSRHGHSQSLGPIHLQSHLHANSILHGGNGAVSTALSTTAVSPIGLSKPLQASHGEFPSFWEDTKAKKMHWAFFTFAFVLVGSGVWLALMPVLMVWMAVLPVATVMLLGMQYGRYRWRRHKHVRRQKQALEKKAIAAHAHAAAAAALMSHSLTTGPANTAVVHPPLQSSTPAISSATTIVAASGSGGHPVSPSQSTRSGHSSSSSLSLLTESSMAGSPNRLLQQYQYPQYRRPNYPSSFQQQSLQYQHQRQQSIQSQYHQQQWRQNYTPKQSPPVTTGTGAAVAGGGGSSVGPTAAVVVGGPASPLTPTNTTLVTTTASGGGYRFRPWSFLQRQDSMASTTSSSCGSTVSTVDCGNGVSSSSSFGHKAASSSIAGSPLPLPHQPNPSDEPLKNSDAVNSLTATTVVAIAAAETTTTTLSNMTPQTPPPAYMPLKQRGGGNGEGGLLSLDMNKLGYHGRGEEEKLTMSLPEIGSVVGDLMSEFTLDLSSIRY